MSHNDTFDINNLFVIQASLYFDGLFSWEHWKNVTLFILPFRRHDIPPFISSRCQVMQMGVHHYFFIVLILFCTIQFSSTLHIWLY